MKTKNYNENRVEKVKEIEEVEGLEELGGVWATEEIPAPVVELPKPSKPAVAEVTEAVGIDDKKVVLENSVSFEVWFGLRKKKEHWRRPMKMFASESKFYEGNLEAWDNLFSKY